MTTGIYIRNMQCREATTEVALVTAGVWRRAEIVARRGAHWLQQPPASELCSAKPLEGGPQQPPDSVGNASWNQMAENSPNNKLTPTPPMSEIMGAFLPRQRPVSESGGRHRKSPVKHTSPSDETRKWKNTTTTAARTCHRLLVRTKHAITCGPTPWMRKMNN